MSNEMMTSLLYRLGSQIGQYMVWFIISPRWHIWGCLCGSLL